MQIIKYLLLLIVSPKMGWEKINLSGVSTTRVLQGAFYPLLALLAVSSFALMAFDSTTWTLARTLMYATVQFCSFFATYFIASYFLGAFFPEIVRTHSANIRLNNFIAFNLMFLVLLEIGKNLLNQGFSPINFLLIYVAVLTYSGVSNYLGENTQKRATQIWLAASALFIVVPVLVRTILGFTII